MSEAVLVEVPATVANMRTYAEAGVIAWSPLTGEEYSADAGDYWSADSTTILLDAEGEPMILVRKVTNYVTVNA